jgi:hypothetical protein
MERFNKSFLRALPGHLEDEFTFTSEEPNMKRLVRLIPKNREKLISIGIASIPLVFLLIERGTHFIWSIFFVDSPKVASISFDWIKPGTLSDPQASQLAMSFQMWKLTALVYFLTGTAAFCIACRTVRKNLGAEFVGFGRSLGFAFGAIILFFSFSIYRENLSFGFASTLPAISAVQEGMELKNDELKAVLHWANYLMYCCILSLGLSLAAVMKMDVSTNHDVPTHDLELKVRTQKSKAWSTNLLLIAFSVFVTAGIVEFQSWMMMPVSWLKEDERRVWATCVSTVASISGMKATMVFSMLFLTVYVFHDFHTKQMARDALDFRSSKCSMADTKKWIEEHDLRSTGLENLAKALAILAPSLTNPILGVWATMI